MVDIGSNESPKTGMITVFFQTDSPDSETYY